MISKEQIKKLAEIAVKLYLENQKKKKETNNQRKQNSNNSQQEQGDNKCH